MSIIDEYAGSRMLHSLALRGDAPAIFGKTTQKTGVPLAAVLATSIIAVTFSIINLNPAFSSKDMLITLMNLTGAIGLLIYLVIACSQLKMRKQLEAKGAEIEIKMWLYPWLTWAVIIFIILFLIGMLFVEEYRLLVGSTAITMAVIAMIGIAVQIKSKVAKHPVLKKLS
jgi:GABA permease